VSGNLAASLRARLKKHADATKEDFNLTLTRFGLERLLYRLSVSSYAGNYLLKGALLFSLWYGEPKRPTRDADLLGFGAEDVVTAETAFKQICEVAVNDGIVFDPRTVKGTPIREEAGYGGVRVNLLAHLDGARISLQVDIGFGDAVTPAPEHAEYPVLLPDLPRPALRVYPKYTVIAEKFHAICLLGMANSRMKDYFDLRVLLTDDTLDSAGLTRAVEATFQRRKLELPASIPIGLSDGFASDATKLKQWTAFLRKNKLDAPGLQETIGTVRAKLQEYGGLRVSS
jgi:hypothetical protein